MFYEIVHHVVYTSFPIDLELFLLNLVYHPMEPHVEGLGSFLADVVIHESSVLLSVFNVVGPCVCLISFKVTLLGIFSLPLLCIVRTSLP